MAVIPSLSGTVKEIVQLKEQGLYKLKCVLTNTREYYAKDQIVFLPGEELLGFGCVGKKIVFYAFSLSEESCWEAEAFTVVKE